MDSGILQKPEKEIVLITGLTGYIGSWIGKLFFDQLSEDYSLRAAVRDISNLERLKRRLDPLKIAYGEENFNSIDFIEADLQNPESLRRAIQGCSFIIHVANPVPGSEKLTKEKQIKPVEESMRVIIDAAIHNKVKRIVVTSSFAAIAGALYKKDRNEPFYDETDYPPTEGADPYAVGKILQERVIEEFLEKQKQSQSDYQLEIVRIMPVLSLGPTVMQISTSSVDGIGKFMRGEVPGVPRLMIPCVDVRDVAQAHINALLKPEINGMRFVISQQSFWMGEITSILSSEFAKFGYKIPKRSIGQLVLKIIGYFDDQVKLMSAFHNIECYVDNSLSRKYLGMKYDRILKHTIVEMGYSLIQQGLVPNYLPNQY